MRKKTLDFINQRFYRPITQELTQVGWIPFFFFAGSLSLNITSFVQGPVPVYVNIFWLLMILYFTMVLVPILRRAPSRSGRFQSSNSTVSLVADFLTEKAQFIAKSFTGGETTLPLKDDDEMFEWLATVTEALAEARGSHFLNAISLGDSIERHWLSPRSQVYLLAQQRAQAKGVAVRRLFVIKNSELRRDRFSAIFCGNTATEKEKTYANIFRTHVEALGSGEIGARFVHWEDLPQQLSIRGSSEVKDAIYDFALFDGRVLVNQTPRPRAGAVAEITTEEDMSFVQALFDTVWNIGKTEEELGGSVSDVLGRVRKKGERFLIEHERRPTVLLVPTGPAQRVTLGELAERLGDLLVPEGLGKDLEAIQSSQPKVSFPEWPS